MDGIDPYRAALENITAMGAVATVLIKPVVDGIKFAFPNMPKSATPGVAVLVGIVVLLLLSVAASVVFTWTLLTQIVLASVVGSLAAIGIHRLHDKADEARQTTQGGDKNDGPPDDEPPNQNNTKLTEATNGAKPVLADLSTINRTKL
jgi:hypothetical protein